jgi:hypothetical protein
MGLRLYYLPLLLWLNQFGKLILKIRIWPAPQKLSKMRNRLNPLFLSFDDSHPYPDSVTDMDNGKIALEIIGFE